MNFGFSEEQALLRAEVRRFLATHSPLAGVRKASQSEHGYSEPVFGRMAELGWLGLLVPEQHGGAGLSWVDVIVLLEATGHGLLPGPLLSNLLVTAALCEYGSAEQQARYLPRLARGELIATLALLEHG